MHSHAQVSAACHVPGRVRDMCGRAIAEQIKVRACRFSNCAGVSSCEVQDSHCSRCSCIMGGYTRAKSVLCPFHLALEAVGCRPTIRHVAITIGTVIYGRGLIRNVVSVRDHVEDAAAEIRILPLTSEVIRDLPICLPTSGQRELLPVPL